MWKCPSCGTMNNSDTCAECGLERKAYSRYKPEMSGVRLFLAVVASLLIIALAFWGVNTMIDQRNRRRAEEYENSAEGELPSDSKSNFESNKSN